MHENRIGIKPLFITNNNDGTDALAMAQHPVNKYKDQNGANATAAQFFCTIPRDEGP